MIGVDTMMPKRITKQTGFTLIELMVTILIASVAILAISGVLADSHKGYSRMFTRVHGNIVTDAYITRIKFDKICRMARYDTAEIRDNATTVKVQYYSTPNITGGHNLESDRYARFYLLDSSYPTELMLDTGTIAAGTPDTTETVARNVTELQFSYSDPCDAKSVQMVMTLADINHSITVTCGSIMHN